MRTSDFVSVSYKQCLKAMELAAYVSLTELHTVQQKCTEALMCSRRIHSLIQSKYDKARSDNAKPLTNVSIASATSSSAQTRCLSTPLATWSVFELLFAYVFISGHLVGCLMLFYGDFSDEPKTVITPM